MLTAVKGIFKNGKIELAETPPCEEGAPVVVTFLEFPAKKAGKMMTLGMFKGSISATEEDFKDAEFDEKKALEKWEKANRAK
ncbi:MAG TPA: hypothetical protein VKX17_10290 [Planctomycetota bacterium]|nr:hypothetical protein [Planctomycetota bacterium]